MLRNDEGVRVIEKLNELIKREFREVRWLSARDLIAMMNPRRLRDSL